MTPEELMQFSDADLRLDEYPFTVRVLSAEDGGGYLIEYPDIPGCISDGETPEQAIHNGKDALRSVLLTKREFGDPIPVPHSSRLLPLSSELTSQLDWQAERRGVKPELLAAELIADGLKDNAA